MRVLVNTTNLVKGGALQAAVSFIRESACDSLGIEWHFAVSPQIQENVQRLELPADHPQYLFRKSPARDWQSQLRLRSLEKEVHPDTVFTIFGPAYTKFQSPHLMGCANAWTTNATWLAYRTLPSLYEKLHMWALNRHCARWFKRADAWVTESPAVKQGMNRALGLPLEKIAVVPNSCAQSYFDSQTQVAFPQPTQKIRLLCFAAPYAHKSLDQIPDVAQQLKRRRPDLNFEFVVTIPPADRLWKKIRHRAEQLNVAGHVCNHGPVQIVDGPELYRRCHLSFMPTVLECFSATYPESMAMGLPIATSDLDFARAICGDAASYFRPRDPAAAAEQIANLLASPSLWRSLIEKGKSTLAQLPTPQQRYQSYVDLLRELVLRKRETHEQVALQR